jgi:glyoxylase-like metal-dependent hydrolase (beta-lactamase superfamily II)
VQLIDGVHLVGSGWLGCSLSSPYDSHVYLVVSAGDAVLVDAGCGLATASIADEIERIASGTTVSRVLLTHGHADHAAGAVALAGRLGARIWASGPVADIVIGGDEVKSGLGAARRAGIYPAGVAFEPGPVDRRLSAESFAVGGLELESIPTPGHAAGHLCFATEVGGRVVVFSGDLVFSRGRVVLLGGPDSDVQLLRSSIAAIARRAPDVLLPGHGDFVLDTASRHLEAALSRFELGQLPEPFLA